MKFGTLRVALLTGETREFPLELPSVLVGRGEGVTILLDDFSISRRHARLTVDSGRLMVEDLASASGTFIDGERATPNVRYLVDEGARLRFGDLEASYFPPPPAEAATASTGDDAETFSPTGLHVALVSPAVAIDPGRQATATLTVTNRGRVVDTVTVEVTDLPPEWYTIETTQSSLLPGAHLDVQVTLHPPRRHDSLAGHYDFTVRVNSQEHQRDAIAIGSFEVLPFESFGLAFEAIRSGRNFRLVAENRGNEPARYALEGRDDEQAFRYQFDAPVVQLDPGQKQVVALRVRRPRQLLGPKIALPFEVVGTAATGSQVHARGQLSVDPPLQKFRMPAMFTLAALVLGVTALGILILTDGESVQTAGAEDEYAGVHLCDEEDAAGKQAEKNEEAASAAPNTAATVAGTFDGGRPIFGQTDANGAPFFAQSDPRWGSVEYARSTELPAGKDWCGTTISQCGCAMTSVAVMLALYNVVKLPDGQPLTPQSLNAWFNGDARRTERGWVSRGYIYGDVIWTAANELSGEIARTNPGTPTVRFVRTGSGSEDEIRAELRAGRPIILEVPGHWIAAVGLDGDTILINDPFYRDRTTLDAYKGKVRSSVLYETSSDLSAVVLTAPADVKFRVTDRQGRVVSTGEAADGGTGEPVNQIPGASFSAHRAWRDPTCIEKAPPADAGTNQITLPGSRDDYTIEILGTGDQTGSIAIHTYGRDGSGSLATIEGQEGTTAELGFDPNAPQPTIRVPNGGDATTTPTPDSGGEGGGPGDETPTPAPAPSATPTPTGTPFVESRTNITLSAEPGQTRVETADNTGFELGDPIRFAPGLPNEEDNLIVGFGSFLLATPLKFAHGPGEPILRLPRPPGQGPGLPPGITPPAQTGPLLPPDTVGMACSTIYQPSPKQATFICDLQVTGDYTNTRWSLNGETVPDFTGSSSFLMAFNDDTPATVSATVCNVTICRSVTRAERIVFPANLGGTTFTGPGGTGTGVPPVVTPPAGGAVAVVCGLQFSDPNLETQSVDFNCEANFSGDYTSISWSAPGGTPANQSGKSKRFTTTVQKGTSTPTSLRITATVCNFGTCRTSEPTVVGIGQTITTLESSPDGQVNSGHQLTLMARVDGVGGIVPQGGAVQFYANNQPFGPTATLFTVGKVSVAQIVVGTGGLDFGDDPEGAGKDNVFFARYIGGINAFGSDSLARIIRVLPPVKDGCDSKDEDEDGIVDNTCRNVLNPSTGFAAAGSYATPKDLGGGTVLKSLTLSGGIPEESTPTTIILGPGEPFTVSGTVGRTAYCPGCVRQLYIGIGQNDTTDTPAIGPTCPVSAILPEHTVGTIPFNTTLNAPGVPGVYYVRATTTLSYLCLAPPVGPPENSVGRLIVREPVRSNVEIWSAPANLWDPLDPNSQDTSAPKQLNEIPSNGLALLRAITDPSVPHGRIAFSTVPSATNVNDAMLTLPPPNESTIVLLQQVCPKSGILGNAVCIPGEARLVVRAGSAAPGQTFEVSASLDTDRITLPTGSGGDFQPFTIRSATPGGTKTLKVLVASSTTLTVKVSGQEQTAAVDVPICADPPDQATNCTELKLSARVAAQPTPLNLAPTCDTDANTATPACSVVFERAGGTVQNGACTGDPASGWEVLGTDDSIEAGAADLLVQPGFGTEPPTMGCFVFRARFERGGTNFEPSTSNVRVPVKFVKAPTEAVTIIAPTGEATIGDSITITATVEGSNGFSPGEAGQDGKLQFRVRLKAPQEQAKDIGTTGGESVTNCTGLVCTVSIIVTTGEGAIPDHGEYELSAVFSGTDHLTSMTSAGFSFTLKPLDPQVTMVLNPGSCTGECTMTHGETKEFRAVLSTSTGIASKFPNQNAQIEFRNNGSALPNGLVAVANLGNGTYGATYDASGLAAQTYDSITAHYGGNNFFGEADSNAIKLTVNKVPVTVELSATSPMTVNTTQTLRATVTPSSAPGSIQFRVGGGDYHTPIPLSSSGTASIPWTPTGVGTFEITAVFVSPPGNYESPVTSDASSVRVDPVLTAAIPSSGVAGDSVVLTANVVPSSAAGNVEFFADGVKIEEKAFSGSQITVSWTPSAAGTYTITATFTPSPGKDYGGSQWPTDGTPRNIVVTAPTPTPTPTNTPTPAATPTPETPTATPTP